ncbi:Pkinase-domain-containing protein [Mycena sanguinolenta]|uniref:Pkinase-domain-containing protein n=1 Tax=Mycena sanguinolenta TaxID=230812 RepID=A0A8H7D0V3_9AGAR|nr:Pkinase-domain-containing protein [Mycena sanguinolenta]
MVSTLTLPKSSPYTVDKTHWTSPEVIRRKEYGFEVDVWAFGITMVEMIDGAPPYAGQEPLKVLFLILVNGAPELKDPDALSDELKDFLSDCLAVDVMQRPTTSELLEHVFLKKACSPAELAPLFEFRPKPEPGEDAVTSESAQVSQLADSTVNLDTSESVDVSAQIPKSQESSTSSDQAGITQAASSTVNATVSSPPALQTSGVIDALVARGADTTDSSVANVVKSSAPKMVETTSQNGASVATAALNSAAPDASIPIDSSIAAA